jgi:predicted porin
LILNPVKPLSIGASFYNGKYGAQTMQYKRNRTTFGLKYDDGKLLVRSEYIQGTTKTTDAYGYYAAIAYYVTSKLQPVLKYDYFKSDKSNDLSSATVYMLGANYWFAKNMRVQLNYSYRNFKNSFEKDTNYLTTQLLIEF